MLHDASGFELCMDRTTETWTKFFVKSVTGTFDVSNVYKGFYSDS